MTDEAGGSTLTTRPIRYAADGTVDPDDFATATRLVLGADSAIISEPDLSEGDVARMLALPTVDRARSCFALDGEEVVGVLRLEADKHAKVTRIDTSTLPWPGSAAVRGQLLDRGLHVARQHRAESGAPEWKARAHSLVADSAHVSLLLSRGLSPVRRFYRMGIDSDSPSIPDVAPPLPDGVEIVTAHDDATQRLVHAVDMASFADHWGHTDEPYDEWLEFWKAFSFDPDDWWLLTVDGVPAAICLLDERKASQGEGYIDVLGVLKEYRGRGLAQLLLRRAFVHYRDLGRRATRLGVDATNTTGAVALYEKVGMSPVFVTEAYEHSLRDQ